MKTLTCNLVKKLNNKLCGAKVLLIDKRGSTVFPHTEPRLFNQGLNIAKHCPKCGFITGYTASSVLEELETDWVEIKRKHDVWLEICRKPTVNQLSLFEL